jgi:translation elongation factor EF-4
MTIHELIKKYGTRSISTCIRYKLPCEHVYWEMADDLQSALEQYASEDFEPPTVHNEVV